MCVSMLFFCCGWKVPVLGAYVLTLVEMNLETKVESSRILEPQQKN
jgi:hypothetical protein